MHNQIQRILTAGKKLVQETITKGTTITTKTFGPTKIMYNLQLP